ncbi:FG-GAP-like repeat-containing protein [Polaribacter sp.]|uniref:FG-GAP-like repeat-containing protein n=1 Tax=Polaribacter sp. TaxID=1920175 RepID=UPI003F6A5E0C
MKYFLFCLFLFFQYNNPIYAQTFQQIQDVSGLSVLEQNNGIAVADYDGDLDLDIFVVGARKDVNGEEKTHSKLFRNNNNGSFTDVTSESGILNLFPSISYTPSNPSLEGVKYGASWGDYDNDGFPDIFFTHQYKVQLFHNNGDGTFTEKTTESGIVKTNNCLNTCATWFDFNNDGYLDLYIADWGECDYNSFYINNGDGTFKNESIKFASSKKNSPSFLAFPYDFNQDGWLDIYISNDLDEPNELLINVNGVDSFEDAASFGLDHAKDDMGISINDYNNDGNFDFFITNINENALLKNNGNNTYTNVAQEKNVKETGWAWDNIFADFDLDGDEDLFIVNGFKLTDPQQNFYFKNLHNQGQDTFQDISSEIKLNDISKGYSACSFDFDNDGDLDLFVSNFDRASYFYSNQTIESNETNNYSWFKLSLEGTKSNRDAIGTSISIETDQGTIHRYYTGIGFLSQSLKSVHFGLGNATEIKKLTIKWPLGLVETYHNLKVNEYSKATEGNGLKTLNVQPANYIYGCTDPESCNYNPLATKDDGSCEYLLATEITGVTESGFNNTDTYTYNLTENNQIIWTVEGGHIVDGQGTNSISVTWGLESLGVITVQVFNENCISDIINLNVTLNLKKAPENVSIARIWNEALLEAIRKDFARPTVHARNLFHTSVALFDSWAIYNNTARPYFIGNTLHGFTSNLNEFTPLESEDISQKKAMSYAAYRLLMHRFKNSPGSEKSLERFNLIMNQLGYDTSFTSVDYNTGNAAALGNYIAQTLIEYGENDGSNERNDYENIFYDPTNPALNLSLYNQPTGLVNPNRWQPLSFNTFIDQSGNLFPGSVPSFLGAEWGNVFPFSLTEADSELFERNGETYRVYHNPGQPPQLDITNQTILNEDYKWNFSLVSVWSSHLDPSDGVMLDISPNTIGNIDIEDIPEKFSDFSDFYNLIDGGDISKGHPINPSTGQPYDVQMVPRGDYGRVLAEFWADGPDSETPPGHWFTILNYVSDHTELEKRFNGKGAILNSLEWDVKTYFILAGAMHDAAIAAWGIKGWYDYIRPISAIRYMSELGQSTNPNLDNYHVGGIPLIEGFIETVEVGDPLSGSNNQNVGKIKLYSWKGHDFISNAQTDVAGVGWILAENWWPYQRPSFVTPPFAGYISGHSTFSRAAAEVMTLVTGDEFFPGGMGQFVAKKDEFLVFEKGPSMDVVLQWATYRDASDQTSLSRIWGGIHPPADDLPGRFIGEKVGIEAYNFAIPYFNPEIPTVEKEKDISLYPNPAEATLSISVFNNLEFINVEIFNLQGKKVISSKSKSVSIESLSSGVYLAKVLTNNGISNQKFIKQ